MVIFCLFVSSFVDWYAFVQTRFCLMRLYRHALHTCTLHVRAYSALQKKTVNFKELRELENHYFVILLSILSCGMNKELIVG